MEKADMVVKEPRKPITKNKNIGQSQHGSGAVVEFPGDPWGPSSAEIRCLMIVV